MSTVYLWVWRMLLFFQLSSFRSTIGSCTLGPSKWCDNNKLHWHWLLFPYARSRIGWHDIAHVPLPNIEPFWVYYSCAALEQATSIFFRAQNSPFENTTNPLLYFKHLTLYFKSTRNFSARTIFDNRLFWKEKITMIMEWMTMTFLHCGKSAGDRIASLISSSTILTA